MNEDDFLKKFAKALGAEDALSKIEQKKIQEEKMLRGMAALFGQKDLLNELETKKAREETELKEKREREAKLLDQMNLALSKLTVNAQPEHATIIEQEINQTIEEVKKEEVVAVAEDLQPMPELPVDDIITKTVKDLSKTAPKNIQQEVDKLPDGIRKELDILKKSIADLHRLAQRQSQMGGGGEVNLRNLDDVDRTTIADGYYLKYDEASKKFVFSNVYQSINVSGSITPTSNNTVDLGTSTSRFQSLYLSGNTIYLGNVSISCNGTALVIPNNTKFANGTSVGTGGGGGPYTGPQYYYSTEMYDYTAYGLGWMNIAPNQNAATLGFRTDVDIAFGSIWILVVNTGEVDSLPITVYSPNNRQTPMMWISVDGSGPYDPDTNPNGQAYWFNITPPPSGA
jgi:hypothetical protein